VIKLLYSIFDSYEIYYEIHLSKHLYANIYLYTITLSSISIIPSFIYLFYNLNIYIKYQATLYLYPLNHDTKIYILPNQYKMDILILIMLI